MNKNKIKNKLGAYVQLVRLDKPIGTLLLMWPMLIALFSATQGRPPFNLFIIFLLGCLLMRSAGCAINDFADRRIDPFVTRTQKRPIAAKKLKSIEAVLIFCVLSLSAFILVLFTNTFTIQLAFIGLLLAFIYPFVKRYTHLPQFFLGAAFAWAVPMAFAAHLNDIPGESWLLYAATLFWAVAYDTEYALVDIQDDRQIGVKSTAILFGRWVNQGIILSHTLASIFLMAFAWASNLLGIWFILGFILSIGLILYQQKLIQAHHPCSCFKAFLNNHWVGAFWFLGLYLELLTRG